MSKRIITGDNPAEEMLLSWSTPKEEAPKKKTSGSRPKEPAKKEIRDVHVNLVLKPSLVEALKDEAWSQRRSLNNLVEEVLTAYIDKKK